MRMRHHLSTSLINDPHMIPCLVGHYLPSHPFLRKGFTGDPLSRPMHVSTWRQPCQISSGPACSVAEMKGVSSKQKMIRKVMHSWTLTFEVRIWWLLDSHSLVLLIKTVCRCCLWLPSLTGDCIHVWTCSSSLLQNWPTNYLAWYSKCALPPSRHLRLLPLPRTCHLIVY